MARKGMCTRYADVYDPVTGMETKECVSRQGERVSGVFDGLATFGQAQSLTTNLRSIKGVVITGALAAGGAILTKNIYDKLGKSLGLSGWQKSAAQIATGIVLAILIGKLLKKPRLAAAIAIGPVVVGVMEIFADVMKQPALVSGLGLTAFDPASPYQSMYPTFYGAGGLGSTPQYQTVPPSAYPGPVKAPAYQAYMGG